MASLGHEYYLAALKQAAVVIGNTSSGIIEAPAAGAPTVNIGIRQEGRLRSQSVVDCPEERGAIAAAIDRALAPAMRKVLATQQPAYGRAGNASRAIFERLRSTDLNGILIKSFHDIEPASVPQSVAAV